jgi:cytochrome c biogenesis protein CcdA
VRVRMLAAEANIAVSVHIMQYAAGLVLLIVLLRHALNQVVHKFSKKKKSRKHITILGNRKVT